MFQISLLKVTIALRVRNNSPQEGAVYSFPDNHFRRVGDYYLRMLHKTILFVHGAAVTSAIWDPVLAHLDGYQLVALDRPRTGDLAQETAWLAERARDAFVVGLGGGATLGLALASCNVRLAGALLHEPAAGTLAPDLLDQVAAAFVEGGIEAFGSTLYGPRWTARMATDDLSSLASELAMFRSFEPAAPCAGQGPVTVSVGERSPHVRHRSVAALVTTFGVLSVQVPGAAHFVSVEAPAAFARLIAVSAGAAFACATTATATTEPPKASSR